MAQPFVHPTAFVAPWVTLADDVIIHPFAVVGRLPSNSRVLARRPNRRENLYIGARTEIGAHAIVYGDVEIGRECLIGDRATIREECRIGNQCLFGIGVTVGYETVIGNRVKIMEGSHMTGRMIIEDDVFVGLNVTTSNDRRVDPLNYVFTEEVRGPILRHGAMIGSGANILPGVEIGANAKIAAGALIVHSVAAGMRILGHKGIAA